jgi:intracellular sulfur oxidation DsrE/DsrF family protein
MRVMHRDHLKTRVARRSFLTTFGTGMAAFGATVVSGESSASAQSNGNAGWQPSRHDQDDWLDQVRGKHRLLFDSSTPAGLANALIFSNNFYTANEAGYGIGNADIALVIVVRHLSTPFAYTDAMWAKYGSLLAQRSGFEDPKTKRPPVINVYNAEGYGGPTVDALVKRGAHLAVCQMSTRALAGLINKATGAKSDDIYNELTANLVGNAHIVPAGIVAVNRAQERGYSLAVGG